ncbi:MAG: PQQ-binding-like beta-propeller repeat protein [Armatimonadota bacterium]
MIADWPHFRGPLRNGHSAETGLPNRFPAGGPRRLWTVDVGEGYSTVSVAGGLAYTAGNTAGNDLVTAVNVATGRVAWQRKYPCSPGDYGGPRATPAVVGGRVLMLSREGLLSCYGAKDGAVVWQRPLAREAKAPVPNWGFASSPVAIGDRVYVNMGAGGACVDLASGKLVWASAPGTAGYASPIPLKAGGQSLLLIFAGTELVAVDPRDGSRRWSFPWQTSYDVNAADPVLVGEDIFIASNYGKGGALVRVDRGKPSAKWQTRSMRNHFNSCVLVGGFLIGNDENTLRCIDAATGAERWAMRGLGKGGLIAADGKLVILTERGELVLANATGSAFQELGRAQVLEGTCWSQPTLSDGKVFCRSHEGALVCVGLR